MNYTANFNLNKPEGTDLYNHLTVDNPNMDTIDAAMQANKLASVGAATELVSGTVHAITRSDSNQNIFKFKATGNFKAGDTITVDGVSVNAYTTAGQQLLDDAYVLSAEVLCILDGTSLWVLVNKTPDASEVPYLTGVNSKQALDAINDCLNANILALNDTFYFYTTYPKGKLYGQNHFDVSIPFFKKPGTTINVTTCFVYSESGAFTEITGLTIEPSVNNVVTVKVPFDVTHAGKLLRISLSETI